MVAWILIQMHQKISGMLSILNMLKNKHLVDPVDQLGNIHPEQG